MQINILSGTYTSEGADFRIAYPYNLVPVPTENGISKGYLRPGEGIVAFTADGPGVDRGGINWNGLCYRVMGTALVEISAAGHITILGTIPGADLVKFDYSFAYLAIRASNALFLWNGIVLQQITDPDLGACIDFIWVDGYFMSTDGEFIAVTELNDPFSVLTTKYGSSEADPDPVIAMLKLHNEPIALNRYTMETFSNIGGQGFPFQRIAGALIPKGPTGTNACCVYMDNIGFVGSGRNEAVSVYLASNGQFARIATREIDLILLDYSEEQLAEIKVETRVDKGHELLLIHLPDQTLVYDGNASKIAQETIWYKLGSGLDPAQYRARNLVQCFGKWLVGDPQSSKIGYLTTDTSAHWDQEIGWEFSTVIVYNESVGAIFHELELVGLTGRVVVGVNPMISTRYSVDGEEWSQPRFISAGKTGERQKKLMWMGQGNMRNWRIQKFNGTSSTRISPARLEARIEPLSN